MPKTSKTKKNKATRYFLFFKFGKKNMAQLLKLPGQILKENSARTFREYASIVFRGMQQTSEGKRMDLPSQSYNAPEDYKLFEDHVIERFNNTVPPCDNKEECIVLPPLFLRSAEYFLVQASPQVYLFAYAEGPIIPLVQVASLQEIMADSNLLSLLMQLYDTLPTSTKATKTNISELFDSK
jgi:hypothetical protein